MADKKCMVCGYLAGLHKSDCPYSAAPTGPLVIGCPECGVPAGSPCTVTGSVQEAGSFYHEPRLKRFAQNEMYIRESSARVEAEEAEARANEKVDHPAHYGGADNPYEAIKVIEAWELGFNLGNTVKYISRAERKGAPLEDLQKAAWYLAREIAKREKKP
jgi:hypothetical protein